LEDAWLVETIGLIAAMSQEGAALHRYIAGWNRIKLGAYRGFRFQINARNCVLIISGMGLSRARDACRTLLEISSPDLLVSFGIAGAVKDDLNIGDVIVAGKTCLLDKGLPGRMSPLASMSRVAWNATAQSLLPDGIRLISGTAITTHGSQVVPGEWSEKDNPILEMETAGISQVADEMEIPLLSIRSISDGPRSPIPFNLEAVMDANDNIQIRRLLLLVMRNPRIIFHSRQLLQNSGKAADHAARGVIALLRQPSPLVSS
jgi:adenosylhomocysteine nucleosidase